MGNKIAADHQVQPLDALVNLVFNLKDLALVEFFLVLVLLFPLVFYLG